MNEIPGDEGMFDIMSLDVPTPVSSDIPEIVPSEFADYVLKMRCPCGITHQVKIRDVGRSPEWWHENVLGEGCQIPRDIGARARKRIEKLRDSRFAEKASKSGQLIQR